MTPRRDWSWAIGNAARSSSSLTRLMQTPRPWLPSSGLSTQGKPIRSAARTAASSLRTVSCFGTGRPAAESSRVVRSLSEAMSTAIAEVAEVIVARIRLAWTPCPSWTRECWLSRIPGCRGHRLVEDRLGGGAEHPVRAARGMNP